MAIQKVRGTNDFFYNETKKLKQIESYFHSFAKIYGYEEIRTPVFEYTELFTRGIGEETDIVGKEMFTFTDRGERSLTLRPEGTASVVRAVIENSLLNERSVNKLYYMGSMFRAERPQKGRYRQFNQFGVECLGTDSPYADVEVMLLNINILSHLSKEYGSAALSDISLEINTVGCEKCKPEYEKALKEYLKPNLDKLCATCRTRYEKNVLRVLDCKVPSCKEVLNGVPAVYDYVCCECKDSFDKVKESLDGVSQKYRVNNMLVRGLDYYTKTVFELQCRALGSQNAVAGGGRYDKLIGIFNNGKDVPAVGSAMGIERLMLILEDSSLAQTEKSLDVFVVAFKETEAFSISMLEKLRRSFIECDSDLNVRSVKSQFKTANKYNALYSIILGPDEVNSGKCVVRNMADGSEEKVDIENADKYLLMKLAR